MMCSSVDLPEPDGPTIAHSSPVVHGQVDAAQRLHAAVVALDDIGQLQDGAHCDSITVMPSRTLAPSTWT